MQISRKLLFPVSLMLSVIAAILFSCLVTHPDYRGQFATAGGLAAMAVMVIVWSLFERHNRIHRGGRFALIVLLILSLVGASNHYRQLRELCIVLPDDEIRYPAAKPVFFPLVLHGFAAEEEVGLKNRSKIVDKHSPNGTEDMLRSMPGYRQENESTVWTLMVWHLLTTAVATSLGGVLLWELIAFGAGTMKVSSEPRPEAATEMSHSMAGEFNRQEGESHQMEWFDQLPLQYDKPGARSALQLLKRVYRRASGLEEVCRLAGMQTGEINFDQPVDRLPMLVLDEAAREKRLIPLLAEILLDRTSTAIHDELWKILGDGADRVHRQAISTNPDFTRVSSLPSPVVPYINGLESSFERIVNALASFQDPAEFRHELAQREARVARVDLSGVGTGTGWLVSPDLLLTAYHVIQSTTHRPANIQVRFDYKFVPHFNGKLLSSGRVVELATNNPIVAASRPASSNVEISEFGTGDAQLLDFALLRLADKIGDQGLGPAGQGTEPRGYFRLPTDHHIFDPREGLLILGHPKLQGDREGGPLKLTLSSPSSATLTTHRTRVRYNVNTEGGSSGSPVMDQSLMPVALHQSGAGTTPAWATSGQWINGFNQGTPLELIVNEIRKQLHDSPVLAELSI